MKLSFSNRLIISSYTFTKHNSSAFSPQICTLEMSVLFDPPIFCYSSHPQKKNLLCLGRQNKDYLSQHALELRLTMQLNLTSKTHVEMPRVGSDSQFFKFQPAQTFCPLLLYPCLLPANWHSCNDLSIICSFKAWSLSFFWQKSTHYSPWDKFSHLIIFI